MVYNSQVGCEVIFNIILLFNLHDETFIYTYRLLASQVNVKCLTQRHNGEVFATELAGNGDFLPQGPASLGNHVMCSSRGVMAHLRREAHVKVKCNCLTTCSENTV